MKAHICKRDENWSLWNSYEDYKPIRFEVELINVVRTDGKWIGIVAYDGVIAEVPMCYIEEWEGFDSSAHSPYDD